MNRSRILIAAALTLGIAGCARPVQLAASLSGAQEVPPAVSPGTGTLTGTFYPSTRALTYNLSYANLTGPAMDAHLHGPAAPGANAGVVVPFTLPAGTAPITGGVTLTDAQAADLLAGKWYSNVHTSRYPNGEIRGQVTHN